MNLDRQSPSSSSKPTAQATSGLQSVSGRTWTSKTTLEDVASGQFSDLVSVIEFNAVEHTSAT
jgi:hypothetical protein